MTKLSRKSDTTAVVNYALGRWPALVGYSDDGRLEIDNNAAERAPRAVAFGRKGYLFAGSDTGGQRAAAIYSLIGSAKLNGLEPSGYLREVLTRIADHPGEPQSRRASCWRQFQPVEIREHLFGAPWKNMTNIVIYVRIIL